MIPYDELVASLARWRVSQGLPVSDFGGTGSTPPTGQPALRDYQAGDDAAPTSYDDVEATAIGEAPEAIDAYDAEGLIEE